MTIPDYSLDVLNLIKYNIGESAYVYSFSFDYTPEPPTLLSDCHFFKTYEIEVVLKSDRSAVTNTFVSFVEPISQGTAATAP